jgi:hypothetical protein
VLGRTKTVIARNGIVMQPISSLLEDFVNVSVHCPGSTEHTKRMLLKDVVLIKAWGRRK